LHQPAPHSCLPARRITFDKENVRDLSTPTTVTTRQGEDVAIGATFIPKHLLVRHAAPCRLVPCRPTPAPSSGDGPRCLPARDAAALAAHCDGASLRPAFPSLQREEGKRMAEARMWSPVKTNKGEEPISAVGAGPSAADAARGSSPAAATSRSSAPASLSPLATPVQQFKQAAAAAAAAGRLDGYDQASACAGSVQREEAQASRPPLLLRPAAACRDQRQAADAASMQPLVQGMAA
jgi:hypothetical protein